MNIATKKKEHNIAEYIVHMYQTEDLIRAYQFNTDDIQRYVIQHIPTSESEKVDLLKWYEKTQQQMQAEGLQQKGHLMEIQLEVQHLKQIMEDLLSDDDAFQKIYQKAKVHIDHHMELAKGSIDDEVQICLNGVYGLLLLRMNGKKIPDKLMESIDAFGELLSYLSYKYKQQRFTSEN